MFAPNEGGSHLLQQIVARATWDREFRKRLLADPDAAIRETFGVDIPRSYRIGFIEKPAHLDALIVLPDPRKADEELDEDDLDAVAGGGETDSCTW